ncbi:MAG: LCCL domain-containing protein [Bacteroidota bacterium]
MLSTTFRILTLCLVLPLLAACDSGDPDDGPQSVDPGNASAVSSLLNLVGGERAEGSPPAPSSADEAPDVSAGASAVSIQPGGRLTLNFAYADGSALAGYYLAVVGADDYFNVPFSGDAAASGTASLAFQIPASLGDGSFDVAYCVYNSDGLVSNIITTTVSLSGNAPGNVDAGGEDSSGGETDGGELSWTENAVSLRGNNGARYRFDCPANGTLRTVWGTDLYTDDSSICTAAVHAGEITQAGGSVVIEIRPGAESYTGSERNGVTSSNWGQWSGSFLFP